MSKRLKIFVISFGGLVLFLGIGTILRLFNAASLDRANQGNEQKTAHFESSTPASGDTLPAVPPSVVLNFNTDLQEGSKLIVSRGDEVREDDSLIDENKLAMRWIMPADAPDGEYTVSYDECTVNGCEHGWFKFRIDRSKQESYTDLTGQPEVSIRMSQIMFSPREFKISKGTKVTWINDDEAIHYVNTDSHPAHTHIPDFNSRALGKGESYTYTFTQPGAYPYHCSAHAHSMTGTIVVE